MNIGNRPKFSLQLTLQEFKKHYWYKTELSEICRRFGLPAAGTKAELEARILKLLSGEPIEYRGSKNQYSRKKRKTAEITLETRLIPDGFKFNRQAREFFAAYFKKEKFSFTKEMAAALREAERLGDHEMTVADLIAVYEGRRSVENPDEKSYEWNRFVQDFNRDPKLRQVKQNRMQVAAALWKQVRDNPGPKRYSPDLLEKYLQQTGMCQ